MTVMTKMTNPKITVKSTKYWETHKKINSIDMTDLDRGTLHRFGDISPKLYVCIHTYQIP